jgi:hypothetical protein
MDQGQRSDKNPLHLIQADGIVGPVIDLRHARRLVVGDRRSRNLLRMLNCTTILQVGGDAGRAASVPCCRERGGLPAAASASREIA